MLLKSIFSLLFFTRVLAVRPLIEIDKYFVENVLRESFHDLTIAVMNVSTEPASQIGMNYATDVRRVGVLFSKNNGSVIENISLIIKQSLFNEGNNGSFNTEISMMSEVFKKMGASNENFIHLTPKLFHYRREFPSFIVMEDLKPLGYRAKDRQQGLDYNHSLLAMDALAQFHAASISVLENQPEIITKWWRGIADTLPANYTREKVQALADLMKTWGEDATLFADEVSKFGEKIYNLTYKHLQPKENGFNVLIHGDYTSRNMLFKNSNLSEPISFMMVDFQFCKFALPVIDLWYFFGTSVDDKLDIHGLFLLVKRYHTTLKTTMKAIGTSTEVISMRQLKSDLIDTFVLYFYWIVTCLPWNQIDKDRIKPIEEFFPYIQQHPESFYNEKFRRIFMKRFFLFEMVSLFDIQ